MKKIFAVTLFCLATTYLFSQNASVKSLDESVSAVSLGNQATDKENKGSGDDISSINQSGDMSLSIPLFTIQSRTMSIPITANYQAGIKVDQQSSEIGLGWGISFGSIVRDYGAFEPDYTATTPEGEMQGEGNINDTYIGNVFPQLNNKKINYDAVEANQLIPDDYNITVPGAGSNTFWNKSNYVQPIGFTFSNQTPWKVEHTVKTFEVSQEFSRINEYNLGQNNITTDTNGEKHLNAGVSYAAAIGLLPYVKNQSFYRAVVSPNGVSGSFNPTGASRKVTYEDYDSFTVVTENGTRYVYGRPLRGQKYMMSEDPYWSTLGAGDDQNPLSTDASRGEHWKMDFIAEWLLTSILSADYEDLNGDGIPNEGDKGDWIRIEYTAPTKYEDVMLGPNGSISEVPMHREWSNLSQTDRASSLMRERAYVTKIVTPVQEIDLTNSERFDVDHDFYSKPANYVGDPIANSTTNTYKYANLKFTSQGSTDDFDVKYPVEVMKYDSVKIHAKVQDEKLYHTNSAVGTVVFNYATKGSDQELAVSEYLIRDNNNDDKGIYNPAVSSTHPFDINQYNDGVTKRGKTTLLSIDIYPKDKLNAQKQSYEFKYGFNPSFSEVHKRKIVRKRFFPSKRQSLTAQSIIPPLLSNYTDENGLTYSFTDLFGNTYSNQISPYDFLTEYPFHAYTYQYDLPQNTLANEAIFGNFPLASEVIINDITTNFQLNPVRDEMGYYRSDLNDPDQDRMAWSMTSVTTPTQGKITFEYEADRFDHGNDQLSWAIKDNALPIVSHFNEVNLNRSLIQDMVNAYSSIINPNSGFSSKLLDASFYMQLNDQSGGLRVKKRTINDGINTPVELNYSYGKGHYTAVPGDYWNNYISTFSSFISQQRRRHSQENQLYDFSFTIADPSWTNDFDAYVAPHIRNIRLDSKSGGKHYYETIAIVNSDGSYSEKKYGATSGGQVTTDIQKVVAIKVDQTQRVFETFAITQEQDVLNTPVLLEESYYDNNGSEYKNVQFSYDVAEILENSLLTKSYLQDSYNTAFSFAGDNGNSLINGSNGIAGSIVAWLPGLINTVNTGNSYQVFPHLSYDTPDLIIASNNNKRQQSSYLRLKESITNYKGVITKTTHEYIPSNGLLRSTEQQGNTRSIGGNNIEESYLTEYTYAYETYQPQTNLFDAKNILTPKTETKVYYKTNAGGVSNQSLLKATAQTFDISQSIPYPLASYVFNGAIDHQTGTINNFYPFNFNGTSSAFWKKTSEATDFNAFGQPLVTETADLFSRSIMGYGSTQPKAAVQFPDQWFDATYTGFEDLYEDKGHFPIGNSIENEFWYTQDIPAPQPSAQRQATMRVSVYAPSCPSYISYVPSNINNANLYHSLYFDNSDGAYSIGDDIEVTFTLNGASVNPIVFSSTIQNINSSNSTNTALCLSDPFPTDVISHYTNHYSTHYNLAVTASMEKITPIISTLSKPVSSQARTGQNSFWLEKKANSNDTAEKTPIRPVIIKASANGCQAGIDNKGAVILPKNTSCAMPYIASVWVKRKGMTQAQGLQAKSTSTDHAGTVSTTMRTEDLKIVYKLWNNNRTSVVQEGHFYLTNTDEFWRYYEIEIPVVKYNGEQQLDVYLENNMVRGSLDFDQIYVDDLLIYPKGAQYTYASMDVFGNATETTNTNDNTSKTVFDDWGRTYLNYDQNGDILSVTKHHNSTNLNQSHNYVDLRTYVDDHHYNDLRTYSDGFGKTVQTMIANPGLNTRTVTQTNTFDDRGRLDKSYLPYALTGINFSGKADPYYTGKTANIYGSTLAYAQNTYEATAEVRSSGSIQPRMTTEAPVQTSTSDQANTQNITVDNITYSINELIKVTAIDPEGRIVHTYSDKIGNTILQETPIGHDYTISATGEVIFDGNTPYETAQTQFVYDRAGNLIKTIDPDGKVTEYFFNSAGQAIKEIHPDKGTTELVYNDYGQVRFIKDQKDANAASSSAGLIDQFKFNKYDGWGRITHSGLVKQTLPETSANAIAQSAFGMEKANQRDYPVIGSVDVLTHKGFVYDGSKADNAVGQLIEETVWSNHQANSDGTYSPQETDTWKFSYTNRGEISSKTVNMDRINADHVFEYEYNLGGLPIETRYIHPTQQKWNLLTRFEYDDLGQLTKAFSGNDANSLTEDVSQRYDVLGRLLKKSIALTGNTTNPYHEQIGYLFNIRGQQTAQLGLNFRYLLDYNKNGNITHQWWSNNQLDNTTGSGNYNLHRYQYYYDDLNRLVGADYATHTSANNPFITYENTEAHVNPPTISCNPIVEVDMKSVIADVKALVLNAQNNGLEISDEVVTDLDNMVEFIEQEMANLGTSFNGLPAEKQEAFIQKLTDAAHEAEIDLMQAEVLNHSLQEKTEEKRKSKEEIIEEVKKEVERVEKKTKSLTAKKGRSRRIIAQKAKSTANKVSLTEKQKVQELEQKLDEKEQDIDFIRNLLKTINVKVYQNCDINTDALAYGDAYTINAFQNPSLTTGTLYDMNYRYTKNGNTTQLQRFDQNGLATLQSYTYGHPLNNQLTGVAWDENGVLSNTSYNYDANGNLLNDTRASVSSITYNTFHNVPQSMVKTSGDVYSYRYTTNEQRSVKDLGNGDVEYYLDGVILDQTGKPKRYNIPEGFATLDVNDHLQKKYQVSDWLGTNRLTIDDAGSIAGVRDHYPFGLQMPQRAFSSDVEGNRYQFTGHEFDGETTFGYHGARYYNRELGKYMSVDPHAVDYPSWSDYNYTMGNPINLIDPDGKNPWKPNGDGTWTAEAGDGAETLARDAGISRQTAYQVLEQQGMGTYVDKDDGITKSAVDIGDIVNLKPSFNISKSFSTNGIIKLKSSSSEPISSPNLSVIPLLETGAAITSNLLFSKTNNTWMGKDFKIRSQSWGGNGTTGGKFKFARNTSFKIQGGGFLLSAYSFYTTYDDYSLGEISKDRRDYNYLNAGVGTLFPLYSLPASVGDYAGQVYGEDIIHQVSEGSVNKAMQWIIRSVGLPATQEEIQNQ